MKKNLFYLFALICSMSLFTACSDDDDTTWQQIPTDEISVEDGATLNINGEISKTGTVQMTVKNQSEATLALKNVIPGYSDLDVNVELEKKADNSFLFAGTTEVNTAPSTREVASDPAILTVEVDGTITLDGKVTVNINASGPGLLVGTYTGEQLALKYSGSALAGRTVYYSVTNSIPVLTLVNIIPGEATTSISKVYPDDKGAFSGEVTTETGVKVAYSGTLTAASGMTLDLNVTMPDAQGLAKAYGLAEITLGELDYGGLRPQKNVPLSGAAYIEWSAPAAGGGIDNGKMYGVTFRGILGIVLPQVLKTITLEADGNISAEYSSDDIEFAMSMITNLNPSKIAEIVAKKTWAASPKNLAYWFEKDGKLHVKLNIPEIVAQAMSDGGTGTNESLVELISTLLNGDVNTIKGLLNSMGINVSDVTLTTLLSWIQNGIPLNVKVENGHTYIYLDKEDLDMLFTSTDSQESDFALLMKALTPLIPTEYKMMLTFLNMIPKNWPATTEFSLGLDLIAK